jgi:hypothetical protein
MMTREASGGLVFYMIQETNIPKEKKKERAHLFLDTSAAEGVGLELPGSSVCY